MEKLIKNLAKVTALGALLFAGACENIGETMNPGLEPSPMIVMSTSGEQYVVAQELNPEALFLSATIGSAGGELTLGNHKLVVPAGAVSQATLFTIQRNAEHPLKVKLTAGENNAVGAAGFNTPVTLHMGYAGVTSLPANAADMKVLYLRPDGLVEPLTSSVDAAAQKVSAQLPHFSPWTIGWPL